MKQNLRGMFAIALIAVCLFVAYLASSASGQNAPATKPESAVNADPPVRIKEKTNKETFTLSVDENGARSDWQAGDETVRIDVNENGLKIDARGIAPAENTANPKRCTCNGCCGR